MPAVASRSCSTTPRPRDAARDCFAFECEGCDDPACVTVAQQTTCAPYEMNVCRDLGVAATCALDRGLADDALRVGHAICGSRRPPDGAWLREGTRGRKLEVVTRAGAVFVLLACAVGCARSGSFPSSTDPIVADPTPTVAKPAPSVSASAVAVASPPPCVPMPAGTSAPVLLDNIAVGFLCGTCAHDAACMKSWVDSNRADWHALLAKPEKKSFTFAPGEFGEPGGDKIRGPMWQLYVVFETPPPPETRDTWHVDLGGQKPFVLRSYTDEFDSLIVEIDLFGDQLPGGGKTALTMTACDGSVLMKRDIELVAKPPF